MAGERLAQGAQIYIESVPSVYTLLLNVGSFSFPRAVADLIDVTSHSSAGRRRQFIHGLIDSEEFPIPVFRDTTDTLHNFLVTNAGSTSEYGFRYIAAGMTTGIQCSVLLRSCTEDNPVDGAQQIQMSVKLTGALTPWTPTPPGT